jgi:hypothetical protein
MNNIFHKGKGHFATGKGHFLCFLKTRGGSLGPLAPPVPTPLALFTTAKQIDYHVLYTTLTFQAGATAIFNWEKNKPRTFLNQKPCVITLILTPCL